MHSGKTNEGINAQSEAQLILATLLEILDRVDQLPLVDSRTADQIVEYDEQGLPTNCTGNPLA